MILPLLIIGHFAIGFTGYWLARESYRRENLGWTRHERWLHLPLAVSPIFNLSLLVAGVLMFINSSDVIKMMAIHEKLKGWEL